jgi:predicted nuclease of predicted toxin-antitoxin system
MRFLLDESADSRLEAFLTGRDHVVLTLVRDYQPGLPDREVLRIAQQEACILITNDRDFGELTFRQRLAHSGVIFFRLQTVDLDSKLYWLNRVLTSYSDQLKEFVVVTEHGVRVRRT